MTDVAATPAGSDTAQPGKKGLAKRDPVALFLWASLGVGIPLLLIPVLVGIPVEPFLLGLVYLALLLPALVITRLTDGPGAIRRLLGRAVNWRFGIGRWLVVVFGVPVLTYLLAAATAGLEDPRDGWAVAIGDYLFQTFIFGALIINIWEEMAWGGFVQTRLMARHGLLKAALLTAVPFVAIHIPLYLDGDPTVSDVATGLGILIVAAPFYRYLLGMHMIDTRGSVLAIGIQHASWNAAGKLDGVGAGWESIVAVVLLTLLVAVGRRLFGGDSILMGSQAEKDAAAGWVAA